MKKMRLVIAGGCAGVIAGLLGSGGGMVLVPLLTLLTDTKEASVFPSSVAIMLPICVVSLFAGWSNILSARQIIGYLAGSVIGGIVAGIYGNKIPVTFLHRFLGFIILWGGIRILC